jgi:hypothetical protein
MPAWPVPCPVRVKITGNNSGGGATSFGFGPGGVVSRQMSIEGPVERLTAAVLPHEITHTVFAHRFGRPVPRWADEGGAVLSEDETEFRRHDRLCREYLNAGKAMSLRRLFALREYPSDPLVLYAQGYSVAAFWTRTGGKPQFLDFVDHGTRHGWDSAVQKYCSAYGYRTVEEFEHAWLTYLRMTRPAGSPMPAIREISTFPGGRPIPGYAQPAPAPPSGGWNNPVRPAPQPGAT